jgi:hypothetical protein
MMNFRRAFLLIVASATAVSQPPWNAECNPGTNVPDCNALVEGQQASTTSSSLVIGARTQNDVFRHALPLRPPFVFGRTDSLPLPTAPAPCPHPDSLFPNPPPNIGEQCLAVDWLGKFACSCPGDTSRGGHQCQNSCHSACGEDNAGCSGPCNYPRSRALLLPSFLPSLPPSLPPSL